MSEEEVKPIEEVKTEIVVEPAFSPLEEAKKFNEENKKLLEEIKEERKKMEKAAAEMMVGGKSFAGQSKPKEETADEKWAREAKVRYAGTGMDPT